MIPYPFTKLSELSFEFVTAQGVTYYAYFLEYGELFHDYTKFSENIYTFNLDVISEETVQSILDERIGLTVVEIFKYFFSSMQNVAIYICDRSDYRHLARKRKFDFWFWRFNDGSVLKEDGIAVIEGVEIYNSILIHKLNPGCNEIIYAFRELNERAGEK